MQQLETAVGKSRTAQGTWLTKMKYKRYFWAYAFILPQAILFFVLTLYPIVMSYVYSLFDWTGIGPINEFIGVANYTKLFQDPLFWKSFRHTIEYIVGETIIVIPIGFILAVLLNNPKFKGRGFYRVLYFIPVVTTTAIVGVVMQLIFSNTNQGLVNTILLSTHLSRQAIQWLNSPVIAMVLAIVIGSWKYIGVVMVYWLAGLQTISEETYEAAELDGANRWQRMLFITLPMLKPISAVVLLFTIVNGMSAFDLIMTFTGGGPSFATQTLDVYVYNYAFNSSAVGGGLPQMGYASAGGVCLGIFVSMICLFIGGLVKLTNRDR
ncbi:carbohydrate ABC transporter permease [Alicyclobacillus fodiniaquatilis]|jgi:multiple sugar transport system permease protein|uniref:Carbohydrate ABC transporter permease n=1 Tax=Alicyclobacillus fodiniaquatilis TaxID=1661150 RepID=A0ABW4JHD2_9BACL